MKKKKGGNQHTKKNLHFPDAREKCGFYVAPMK